jgi:hypothetical protein
MMENGIEKGTEINRSWNCCYYCNNNTPSMHDGNKVKLLLQALQDNATLQKLKLLEVKP